MRWSTRLVALALVLAACGGGPGTIATVNGAEITRADLEDLHPDLSALTDREVSASLLLLIIHESFVSTAADELGLVASDTAVQDAFAVRTQSAQAVGDLEAVLANRRITVDRVRLESELDALREIVGPALVRNEAPGFDLDAAYDAYVQANGTACVRQILLTSTVEVEDIVDRANGGESFDSLAREFSQDNLAQRPEGESGAGGDMGCGAPQSFGLGLAEASVDEDIPVGEAFGPVISDRGLHVVVVYEREIPELESVRSAAVEAAIPEQSTQVFTRWGADVLRTADVTIDAAYGVWEAVDGTDGIPTVAPSGE